MRKNIYLDVYKKFLFLVISAALPQAGLASSTGSATPLDLTGTGFGFLVLLIFLIAYALVISEEFLHLRKSKPVIIAAGLIWVVVGIAYVLNGDSVTASKALRHNILEYAEIMLFLLAAMTYINTMEERDVFNALRARLVSSGYTLRTIYWISGILAFFISSVADNLTTALLMTAITLAIGAGQPRFIVVSCINIVVAANAGGAFSPFGDITTLMVWQQGIVKFHEFFDLFIPSLVNWLVPAAIMSLAIPKVRPHAISENISVKRGGFMVIGLFVVTLAMAVSFHQFLHLPPVLGMMTGLGLLQVYGYFLKREDQIRLAVTIPEPELEPLGMDSSINPTDRPFDIFNNLRRVEWDTLLFFYGVVLCVGGLGAIGYLALLSQTMYGDLGPTTANILVGLLSSIVDNIPVMFAVLTMNPDMSHGQWLLVTLTAGVGGSLLSIGSAAGVAVMGQARGIYTFFAHLKWSWAIALGYTASIWVHFLINSNLM
ncbi:MAG: sodium:proton antiporter NhaD [Gammaproteobacteria bacterium]|nr:sodium:proton antiporter NhaD [Gammaproteobacteria bacterium]